MIADLTTLEAGAFEGRKFDVCVVGTGPAGMTVAMHLARSLEVLLVEGGGLEYSEESQELYRGRNVGREYFPLDSARLRFFGGSSGHWAGWCQALEDFDFEAHPHIPLSGWPIAKTDLDPYYDATAQILDISQDEQRPSKYQQGLESVVTRDGRLAPYSFLWSAPTRFGDKFQGVIEAAENITCVVNANLIDIVLNDARSAVATVTLADLSGKASSIAVKALVVAAGGLENPRILLNCSRQVSGGLGNQNDLVGRCFGEHPQHTLASIVLEDELRDSVMASLTYPEMTDFHNFTYFRATEKFVRESAITNFGLRFIPLVTGGQGGFKDRLNSALCAPDWLSRGLDLVSFGPQQFCADGIVHLSAEQAPNLDSRVTLGEERDRFGWRRMTLDWRMSEVDRRTVRFAAVHFARLMAERDLGRMRIADWVLDDEADFLGPSHDEAAGYHHIGTTRMADDPKRGVVDRNCRVHGLENLYMAGSSIFSTGGQTNPTFSIVQLALRLADHLNTRVA